MAFRNGLNGVDVGSVDVFSYYTRLGSCAGCFFEFGWMAFMGWKLAVATVIGVMLLWYLIIVWNEVKRKLVVGW